ncbi:MAG: ATP-binding cassette domain-containing protein [Marmoricola sp.]
MIEIDHLTKRYGGRLAVDDLTFNVSPGRVTGFLGPNGAGKSTTIRSILGLATPDGGRVVVNGKPYRSGETPLRIVGSLLDGNGFHPGRGARQHLDYLAASNGLPPRRVHEVLQLTGLTTVARRRVGTFSLGMKQRLGIAAALLGDPQILVLDEPTNGLDPEGILWLRGLLKERAADGGTVLVSSHLMTEMSLTADHLVVIGRGRLLADVSLADLVQAATGDQGDPRTLEDAYLHLTRGTEQFQAVDVPRPPAGDGR